MRGTVRFFRSIYVFLDGISESAELKPKRCAPDFGKMKPRTRRASGTLRRLSILSALLVSILSVALFMIAAPIGMGFILNIFGTGAGLHAFLTAFTRACGFVLSFYCISHTSLMRPLLRYRYAINQCVNCFENGDSAVPEVVSAYPRYPQRSEPAFFIGTVFISLLLFPLLPDLPLPLLVMERLIWVACAAALLGEPVRAIEEADESKLLIRILRFPMDMIEHMLTLPPDPAALTVAVCALQTVTGELEAVEDTKTEDRSTDV